MANEKRLIDAESLKQRIVDAYCQNYGNALILVNEEPTVDAVPVDEYIELREQYDKIFLAYHELRDNFISYVCGGIPNPSPFCLNKRKGCCNCYGWCLNNDKCKGFNPAEVILDGERKDNEKTDF